MRPGAGGRAPDIAAKSVKFRALSSRRHRLLQAANVGTSLAVSLMRGAVAAPPRPVDQPPRFFARSLIAGLLFLERSRMSRFQIVLNLRDSGSGRPASPRNFDHAGLQISTMN
jgi:hypothetical protein